MIRKINEVNSISTLYYKASYIYSLFELETYKNTTKLVLQLNNQMNNTC